MFLMKVVTNPHELLWIISFKISRFEESSCKFRFQRHVKNELYWIDENQKEVFPAPFKCISNSIEIHEVVSRLTTQTDGSRKYQPYFTLLNSTCAKNAEKFARFSRLLNYSNSYGECYYQDKRCQPQTRIRIPSDDLSTM